MKELYSMLSKRVSIRKSRIDNPFKTDDYDNIKTLIDSRMKEIKKLYDYNFKYELVDIKETNSKIGEFAICIYSEKFSDNLYLINIGYIFEQLELYLESIDIGVCWLGIPRPKKKDIDGLPHAIMLGLTKINSDMLRKDENDFKRKDYLWEGEFNNDVIIKSMLAPSSCNSQPWNVKYENNIISVYRNKKVKTIIPRSFLSYYNNIDMGIYLCFLEVALEYNNYKYDRKLMYEETDNSFIKIAEYKIKNGE